MGQSDALEEATSRLTRALETFEKTVADRRHADLSAEALEEQVQALSASLEAESEKSLRLTTTNDEVSERLESIMDSVKSIIGSRQA